jgi:hypothetical protein
LSDQQFARDVNVRASSVRGLAKKFAAGAQTCAPQNVMTALPPKANIQTADHESERLVVEPPL